MKFLVMAVKRGHMEWHCRNHEAIVETKDE